MSRSKNINYQRVCLFIVEGATDKIALNNILSKYFASKQLRTFVVGTDITSDRNSTTSNIESVLAENVRIFIRREKLKKTDIARIIHLTDLDGAFIDDKYVVYNDKCEHPYYTVNDIQTAHTLIIKERNHRKAQNILALQSLEEILSIPYKLYFMSCNLDHVLYNANNLSEEEKQLLAEQFSEKFLGKELTFLNFLMEEGVIDKGTYNASWADVQIDKNSLLRKTNIDKAITGN